MNYPSETSAFPYASSFSFIIPLYKPNVVIFFSKIFYCSLVPRFSSVPRFTFMVVLLCNLRRKRTEYKWRKK